MENFLANYKDPYEAYYKYCRPIKSRLALFYIKHKSIWLDLQLLFYNFTNFISHKWTLNHMANLIIKLGGCGIPHKVLRGEHEIYPMPLP